MNRILLWSHVAFVVAAYSLFGLSFLFLPRTTSAADRNALVVSIVTILAALGSLTGFGLMARRSGTSESIALAISTVAAFLLLVMAR